MSLKSVTFIVNPVSGGKGKGAILGAIARGLDLDAFRCEFLQTSRAGEAEELARASNSEIVVAVGGDGTVSEVAKGLIGTSKAMGIIPCGSGNGLALHLGISRDPARAVKVINEGVTACIDTASVNGRMFLVTAGVGLDAAVSQDFASSKKRGLQTYIQTAIEDWISRKPEQYIVETDFGSWSGKAVFVTVGNANQWGNDAKITPLASLRDGLLDVTIVEPFSALEAPDLAARLMTGKTNTSRKVCSLRGTNVFVHRNAPGPAHADGDPFTTGEELAFEIAPATLNVVIPRSRAGKI